MLAPWKERYGKHGSVLKNSYVKFKNKIKLKKKKNRDITLLTEVCLVKAMIFPVVMYGYESWTVMKAGCQRVDAFKLWCWRTLESLLDSKQIKPVNPKENHPEHLLEGLILKLKLQY